MVRITPTVKRPPTSPPDRPPRSGWRLAVLTLAAAICHAAPIPAAEPHSRLPESHRSTLSTYCFECHDSAVAKGQLDLETITRDGIPTHSDTWEKVVRKLATLQMPPPGQPRPSEASTQEVLDALTQRLDDLARRNPAPGRADGFRRLNRAEYQNAIRDLLALDIDAALLLPKDEASQGFDSGSAGGLSPALLTRYLAAAEKISRLAVGRPPSQPSGEIFRTPPDLTQEDHFHGLPPGTRGGLLVHPNFPCDGEYEFQIRLTRDRNEEVEGLRESHQVLLLVDRHPMREWSVAPPKGDRDFSKVDAHLTARLPLTAGPHSIAVTFRKKASSLPETRRQPYLARYNMHRHPRLTPAIQQLALHGPYLPQPSRNTPSRNRIFVSTPTNPEDESACATHILTSLLRRAFRRPVEESDLRRPMQFYREAHADHGFEAGIEAALTTVLASPHFLFRIETTPAGATPGSVHPLSDIALASRLSFLLWSSIPDDELLAIAERGELHRPETLDQQVRRMLADPRAASLDSHFAGQWLHLRNLDAFTPDLRLFPDFDDNLRQAFRRETERHFEAIRREDRSVLELLHSKHTFLNERLARHYGIPHILGDRFRPVPLAADQPRGGILRQGSVLTVTSYATRTSPVIRGNWVLGNLLGTPPPPPPPNVPPLRDSRISDALPMRLRLAEHRANPACSSCHDLMDPVGFALEQFDAIGRWRTLEDGHPVDASGSLPDGSRFAGASGLEAALLRHPELFVATLTEKLLTFALGRGIQPSDGPAVRKIVRDARATGYSFSSILRGIALSTPFTLTTAP